MSAVTDSADVDAVEDDAVVEDALVIVPDPGALDVGGIPCKVNRLRTREMLAMMKILTRTAGAMFEQLMSTVEWSDPDAARAGLQTMFVMSMPEAPNETIEFVRMMVSADVDGLDPKEAGERMMALAGVMENPDLDVLVDVIVQVLTQEWNDFGALVGKVGAMARTLAPTTRVNTAKKTPAKKAAPTRGKSGRGRARST